MIDTFLAFLFGVLLGYLARPKEPELQQQIDIYNRNYEKYEKEIKYYKELCQWHVSQGKNSEE